jgi:predicted membrane-bound spermidine synthase
MAQKKKPAAEPPSSSDPTADGAAALAYGTVATTGAVVMMIEVLGTRLIAPFYGVGLFVWTALIAVAMVALAVGYRIGGRLADREGPGRLALVIAGAALLVAVIPLMKSTVLVATDPLGLRLGSLAAALILFGGPLTLLGMVGPYVLRLRTDRLDTVGTTAGGVLAVSTFGSVLGTLLIGFVLLPSFGTRAILFGISALLLILAAVVGRYERRLAAGRVKSPVIVSIASILALILGGVRSAPAASEPFRVLHDQESLYGRVRVVDDTSNGLRWMLVDASAIGTQFVGTEETAFPYLYALETLGEFRPQARSALVIGLGAGYLPRVLARQGMAVDTIEIDPVVVSAARRHFGFTPPGDLIVGDARYELRRLQKRYDIIIHDCFTGGEMPWHLFSAETLRTLRLRGRLTDDGILALNFFGLHEGRRVDPLSVVAATLDAEFPHRLTLAPAPGHELFDRLFLVSPSPIVVPLPAASRRPLSVAGKEALAKLPGMVTTLEAADLRASDDFNPLESLQLRKGEAYRRLVLARFGPELLAQ